MDVPRFTEFQCKVCSRKFTVGSKIANFKHTFTGPSTTLITNIKHTLFVRYLLLATAGKRKTLSNISFTVRLLCIRNGSNLDSILSNSKTCQREQHSVCLTLEVMIMYYLLEQLIIHQYLNPIE